MGAHLSLIGRRRGWGGRLFEAGCLLTFSAFGMGAYSRWALIRINTVPNKLSRAHGAVRVGGGLVWGCGTTLFKCGG